MKTLLLTFHISPLTKVFFLLPSAFSLLLALLLGSSCKNGGVEPPPPPDGLDTTSHEFVWQIDTLGDASSILNDVFIIDENNIWAVGEIYLREAGQIDPQPYALAKWNGSEWSLHKVPYHDFGSTETNPGILNTILAFSLDDVYVVSYANLLHWDGTTWTEMAFFMTAIPFDGQVNRMWGTNGSNIYCVGRNGAIYHFIGASWQKLESGTTVGFLDVNGNAATGVAFAVASSQEETKVYRIEGTQVSEVPGWPSENHLGGIWVSPSSTYVSGVGIWRFDGDTTWNEVGEFPLTFYRDMAGNSDSDFMAGSWGGVVAHYNGNSWHLYEEIPPELYFNAVAVKGNTAVAVGFLSAGVFSSGKAITAIGRRIQ